VALIPTDPLTQIRAYAEELVAGTRAPDEVGRDIWATAMSGAAYYANSGAFDAERDHCHGLWLVWGALTDEPESSWATMLRAAREWLAVRDDERKWRPWLHHWIYEEMGY
jgi:hypothetical protein